MVPACSVCTAPPSVSPDWYYEPADMTERFDPSATAMTRGVTVTRDAVLAVIRMFGQATTGEIAAELGVADFHSKGYDAIASCLRRMRASRLVLTEARDDCGRGNTYRVNPNPPTQPTPGLRHDYQKRRAEASALPRSDHDNHEPQRSEAA